MGRGAKTIEDLYHELKADTRFLSVYQPGDIDCLLVSSQGTSEATRTTLKLSLASSAYYHLHQEKEADFGAFDYLQFYAQLHVPIIEDHLPEVNKKVLEINAQLPLIGFGLELSEDVYRLHYRHIMLIEKESLDVPLISRAVELIFFLISEYEPTFHPD